MADVVLLTAIISLVSILLILLTILRSRVGKGAETEEEPVHREQVRRPVAVDRENPRPVRARRNRLRPSQVTRQQEENEEEDEEAEDPLAEHIALPEGKIGAKKRKKLEMKAEKRAQREMEEQEREERKQRQVLLEEQRQKQEQKEREEEAKREEEERLRKEEQKKQEHEEYLKLKESFNVEDEGFDEKETDKEVQDLLKEFIDYIKKNKVVLMEDLATHFKMKTQDAINRVQTLQSTGRLSGVVDDRGKFIYISKEELESVAKFIRQRGRVSVAELVENSNLLINLNPTIS